MRFPLLFAAVTVAWTACSEASDPDRPDAAADAAVATDAGQDAGADAGCYPCGEVLQTIVPPAPSAWCPTTAALVSAANACLCDKCASDCGATCSKNERPTGACLTCFSTTCGTAYNACLADRGR